ARPPDFATTHPTPPLRPRAREDRWKDLSRRPHSRSANEEAEINRFGNPPNRFKPFGYRSSSVRIGHVPLTAKPASIAARRKVSQPVLEIPSALSVSDCLNA